jgi:D-aminoacyl-tRNA deacylase
MSIHWFEQLHIKVVLQRVENCEILANGISRGMMPSGFLLLFGVGQKTPVYPLMPEGVHVGLASEKMAPTLQKLANKILGLRIFSDSEGKMNLSLQAPELQTKQAGIYIVSQFTLFADLKNGFRPSFTNAAPPALAETLYNDFVNTIKSSAPQTPIFTGEFGSDMKLHFTNDGPVTILFSANVEGLIHAS